ncbi:hypothetical protein BJ546DRAFT_998969 [Cryomyces antarcticus]
MPSQTVWGKTKTQSKFGFDKLYGWVDKLGPPVNKLTNKLGSEAFWPTTLDKESDKAARILRSFCKDGFYQEEVHQTADGPKQKQRVLKKIPAEVVRKAKGLAIFTTMRTGLWVSGAGGSGILVGRKEDGTWSPPSGIMLHTAGVGFLAGVDVYDCVVVINTQAALDAFSKIRCTLGGEVSVVAGPLGAGGVLETEIHKRQAPVFTYMKSRGLYGGIQVDGTIVIERTDENERFYNEKISVANILAGKVRHPPYEIRTLMETIKAAQGDTDVDEALLPSEPPPGDLEIEDSGHIFGVPDREDPDPYGVRALEMEGFEIKEAGTGKRASGEASMFQPNPSSPVYGAYSRRSLDRSSTHSVSRRNSWRTSTLSTMERATPTTDMSTQTDFEPSESLSRWAGTSPRGSPRGSVTNGHHSPMDDIPENRSTDNIVPLDDHTKETKALIGSSAPVPNGEHPDEHHDEHYDGHDDEPVIIEEPVVHSVRKAAAPQVITRARLVTVPKRVAPRLPPRNPNRRGPLVVNAQPLADGENTRDYGTGTSPTSSSGSVSPTRQVNSKRHSEHCTTSVEKKFGDASLADDLHTTPNDRERSTANGRRASEESNDMPGTFHSIPTTPDLASPSPVRGGFLSREGYIGKGGVS